MAEDAMTPAMRRVQDRLREAGIDTEVQRLAATARTAQDAAAAIGCAVAQIAKSLVFRSASGRSVLVIASGTNRVDEAKIAAALGEPVEKASADFVRERTGFAIGGVAPVGHAMPPCVFLDEDLGRHDVIWAAAGHPHAVFRLTPPELERLTGGTVIAVS